jgi:hypothetical protein
MGATESSVLRKLEPDRSCFDCMESRLSESLLVFAFVVCDSTRRRSRMTVILLSRKLDTHHLIERNNKPLKAWQERRYLH